MLCAVSAPAGSTPTAAWAPTPCLFLSALTSPPSPPRLHLKHPIPAPAHSPTPDSSCSCLLPPSRPRAPRADALPPPPPLPQNPAYPANPSPSAPTCPHRDREPLQRHIHTVFCARLVQNPVYLFTHPNTTVRQHFTTNLSSPLLSIITLLLSHTHTGCTVSMVSASPPPVPLG